jgi:predicted ABC-class ATPase
VSDRLRAVLRRIDGRGYPAYHDIKGVWELTGIQLSVDHVQGDPFAAPSRLRVRVPLERAGFAPEDWSTEARSRFLRDLLTRRFGQACRAAGERRGSGKSGQLEVVPVGQEVLDRTAVLIDGDALEARFTAGLPAAGRRVLGREAEAMLCEDLPRAVERALLKASLDPEELAAWRDGADDSAALRRQLAERGFVGFVADGSVLPRRTGVDDRPMEREAVPFKAPASLRVTVELPHRGRVSGLGIPAGVTVIVGGGYHGKSTLLRALERGVWDHVPGDGRELVATAPGAVKVRAEDGRSVAGVDIAPFIGDLPGGRATDRFTTADASGSTSQAASIVEALEAGATALLLDEDTSATNFLLRDARMQRLVAAEREPITPLLDRVESLRDDLGVSTVLVVGGSGDWFDVADTVIALDAFVPWDATGRARAIASEQPTGRAPGDGRRLRRPAGRVPRPESLDPRRGRRASSVKVLGRRGLLYGEAELELSALEQVVEAAQMRTLGHAIEWLRRGPMDGRRDLPALLDAWDAAVAQRGLAALLPDPDGDAAAVRRFEIVAALSRLRSLRVA